MMVTDDSSSDKHLEGLSLSAFTSTWLIAPDQFPIQCWTQDDLI